LCNLKVSSNMKRDIFQGIADPTRREILNMIAYKSLNVNAVTENFDVSRTAIYKHIKILTECGLIVMKQQGRERYCEARLDKLGEVTDWIEKYRKIWAARFDSLDDYLQALQSKSSVAGKKKRSPKTTTTSKSKYKS
jgi:DNA-binding transcriptional ArsR family regulator